MDYSNISNAEIFLNNFLKKLNPRLEHDLCIYDRVHLILKVPMSHCVKRISFMKVRAHTEGESMYICCIEEVSSSHTRFERRFIL